MREKGPKDSDLRRPSEANPLIFYHSYWSFTAPPTHWHDFVMNVFGQWLNGHRGDVMWTEAMMPELAAWWQFEVSRGHGINRYEQTPICGEWNESKGRSLSIQCSLWAVSSASSVGKSKSYKCQGHLAGSVGGSCHYWYRGCRLEPYLGCRNYLKSLKKIIIKNK